MGKMFGNLTTENLEEAEDRLGGGNEPLPSGVYDAVIKMAYAGQSQGGAHNVTLILDIGGRELRETVYITNRNGENFYADKQDKSKKHPLPGFTLIDDICMFATEEPISEQDTAMKMVKVYDFDEKKEVPTEVPVLTGLLNKPITVAVLREITVKQKRGDDGVYRDTNETRTQNTIDKAFHPETKRTINEYRHEVTTPEFHDAWVAKNAGKDRDRTGGKTGAGASGTGRPGAAGGAAATPKKKLFGG